MIGAGLGIHQDKWCRRHRSLRPWLGLLLAATLIGAACGGGNDNPDTAAPPPPTSDPPATVTDPPASEPSEQVDDVPGIIVDITLEDIPGEGFESIPFYHDVPGLLRELDDSVLSGIGQRASDPDLSGGQGFANPETGELIFVITIALQNARRAVDTIDYIDIQPVEDILLFISPDETLFESEQRPSPGIGDVSLQYFLRYGVEEDGERLRDVTTDLVIFARGGSLVFLLRSVNTTDDALADGLELDMAALSVTISNRFDEAIETASDESK
jgi:hypothetical protein